MVGLRTYQHPCRTFLFSLTLCSTSPFFTRSVRLIFFHYSPAPHFKTFQMFLIYFPKGPSFSTTQSCPPSAALYWFLPAIKVQFAGEKSLAERCFCNGNAGFNSAFITCILIKLAKWPSCFSSITICTGDSCLEIVITSVFLPL